MSLQMKIGKLRTFIAQNPALADSPIGIVAGHYLTPRTALSLLQRGEHVNAVIGALAEIGVDPPERDWALVEGYYQELLMKPGRKPTTFVISEGKVKGESLTVEQALAHIRARDAIGRSLLKSYQGYLGEVSRRMQRA